MAFYLEKAIFVNRAPFEHLELDFKEKGINVLSAINGRGKTTILSYIVDAFYELAKKNMQMSLKAKKTNITVYLHHYITLIKVKHHMFTFAL